MPTPRKDTPRKPDQPKGRPGVNPDDPVDQASDDSFPASDPPSFSGSRAQPHEPSEVNEGQDKMGDKERMDRQDRQRMERERMEQEKGRKH